MKAIKPSFKIELTKEQAEQMILNVEKYGRICYKSEPVKVDSPVERANKFIADKIKAGHESIIEHEKVTAIITCDRGVTHEIVRHRIASYSQESTRYCNYAKDKFGNEITVIDIATGFNYNLNDENDKKKYDVWCEAMKNAEKSYFKMLELGAKPQEARSVLPNSTKAEIVVTMNLRSWRHFFALRAAGVTGAPHPQMKEIALPMLKEFYNLFPCVFEDIVSKLDITGSFN